MLKVIQVSLSDAKSSSIGGATSFPGWGGRTIGADVTVDAAVSVDADADARFEMFVKTGWGRVSGRMGVFVRLAGHDDCRPHIHIEYI